MELALLPLSYNSGFAISFHIVFPSFTIGLTAWLRVLEALRMAAGRSVYRTLFDFWLKVFGVAFGLGASQVSSWPFSAVPIGAKWRRLLDLSKGRFFPMRRSPHSCWKPRSSAF
jgi:cytochrome d ubiquinol oxidase subunit I